MMRLAVFALLLAAQSTFVPSTSEERYVTELRDAAARGDVEAEVTLANMYEAGSVVQQDVVRAAALYRDAASRGHVGAQMNLAMMYAGGQGVRRDAAAGSALAAFSLGTIYEDGAPRVARDLGKAASSYRQAAGQCFVSAQYRLGRLYADGRGVARDVNQAMQWLRKAADQGDADAQIALGTLLTRNGADPTDVVEAHMWLNLAASRWKDEAKRIQAGALRDGLEKAMSEEQRAAAARRAAQWQDAHSERGRAVVPVCTP
jgi:TPR repeat protein